MAVQKKKKLKVRRRNHVEQTSTHLQRCFDNQQQLRSPLVVLCVVCRRNGQ